MNPLDAVNNILNSSGSVPPTTKYLVCRQCTGIVTISANVLPPAVCVACNKSTSFVVMPNREKAIEVQTSMKAEISNSTTNQPLISADPEPVAAPKTRVRKPTEKPVEAVIEKPVEAIDTPSNIGVLPDLKARRLAAMQKLIKEKGLNEVEFKECGSGKVYSLGFTTWEDHLPSYSFMELTDSPQSFREAINEARKVDGKVTVDIAKIVGLSDGVLSCSFDGTAVANLKSPHGLARVAPDQKVTLLARVSRSGNLIYCLVKA